MYKHFHFYMFPFFENFQGKKKFININVESLRVQEVFESVSYQFLNIIY